MATSDRTPQAVWARGFSRPDVARGFSRAILLCCSAALLAPRPIAFAQSPTFGLGRAPTTGELKAIDIEVLPDGRGLPTGSGTAEAGKPIYAARCTVCHGATGKEGPQDILVGGQGTLNTPKALKTVGSYWPYATTLWDYINRAMPFDHPGTLPADHVYAATAYVLFINGVIGERDVMNQTTLPQVKMPNRTGFVADPRPDVGHTQGKPRTPRTQREERKEGTDKGRISDRYRTVKDRQERPER